MRSRYTLWLKLAIAFMFITGAVHGVGLFASPEPTSETEQHMLELMSTYRLDIGDGFRPTMSNLIANRSSLHQPGYAWLRQAASFALSDLSADMTSTSARSALRYLGVSSWTSRFTCPQL